MSREAKVASRLTDPHVVPIHRHGEIDGQLFLDMRLVDGPLDVEAAVRLIEQVAGALDAGLVHRDVEPANVFLTRDRPGTPRFAYLGDFGIARRTSGGSLTATGATVGTLDDMAPERFAAWMSTAGPMSTRWPACSTRPSPRASRSPTPSPPRSWGATSPPTRRPSEHATAPVGGRR